MLCSWFFNCELVRVRIPNIVWRDSAYFDQFKTILCHGTCKCGIDLPTLNCLWVSCLFIVLSSHTRYLSCNVELPPQTVLQHVLLFQSFTVKWACRCMCITTPLTSWNYSMLIWQWLCFSTSANIIIITNMHSYSK